MLYTIYDYQYEFRPRYCEKRGSNLFLGLRLITDNLRPTTPGIFCFLGQYEKGKYLVNRISKPMLSRLSVASRSISK